MMDQYVSMQGVCGSFWQLSEDERIPMLSALASINEAISRVYDSGTRNFQDANDGYVDGFVLQRSQYVLGDKVLTTDDEVPVILSIYSDNKELLLGVDYKRTADHSYEFTEDPVAQDDGSFIVGTAFKLQPSLAAKTATQAELYQSSALLRLARYSNNKDYVRKACMEFLHIPYATKHGVILAYQPGIGVETSTESIPFTTGLVTVGETVQPGDSVIAREVNVYCSDYSLNDWWSDSTELVSNVNLNWFVKGATSKLLNGLTANLSWATDTLTVLVDGVTVDIPCSSANYSRLTTALGGTSGVNAVSVFMLVFGVFLMLIEFTPSSYDGTVPSDEAADLYRFIRPFLSCNLIVKIYPSM